MQAQPTSIKKSQGSLSRSRGRPRAVSAPQGLPGLAAALTARGWSPLKLAAELDICPATVLSALRGKDPCLANVRRMCALLGVTPNDLMMPASTTDATPAA